MESLLVKARDLVVLALPTLFLLTLLYFYLRATLFGPLAKMLEERRQATSGTRKAADESLKLAERRAAEYEEKLRAARGEIYKEQEAVRKKWRDEQAAALAGAREKTDAMLREAEATLSQRAAEAKAALGAESEALAEKIVKSVLAGRSN